MIGYWWGRPGFTLLCIASMAICMLYDYNDGIYLMHAVQKGLNKMIWPNLASLPRDSNLH